MKAELCKKSRSKLTAELQEELCKYLKLGMSPPKAAEMCGVHRNTMRYWLRRGREDWGDEASRYAGFLKAVNHATAHCMRRGLLLINQAMAEDYRAAAWLLERRFPDEFAPKQMVMVQAQQTIEDIVEALGRRLPPDVYDTVLRALRDELEERRITLRLEAAPVLEELPST